ncbi:zinc finger CCCH domain-containing protein 19-like isoform X2 [Cornus florida]|uniref:zinc finger CCCH domain-containing protein 19-like isoform X2 n=1 Tax=Cornus florida TaxID=4283 RepID=UPI0028A13566|nr:zinc finger CCCH domain-containing protein 19-like isoform X2 [Cornus florida]
MEDEPIETEELANTEKCEFVSQSLPELGDSQLGGEPSIVTEEEEGGGENAVTLLGDLEHIVVESPIAAKEDKDCEAVAEEENLMADIEPQTETAKGSGEKSVVQELEIEQIVGAETSIGSMGDGDDKVVAEEENLTVDNEMETETAKGNGESSVQEIEKAEFNGAESSVASMEDGDDKTMSEEENLTTQFEMETEGANGSAEKSVQGIEDGQLAGAKFPIASLDDGDGKFVAEKENLDTQIERESGESIGSGEESYQEIGNAQPIGTESPIASVDDEDDKAVAAEDPSDTEIETEAELAKGSGVESVPELDDTQLVGAVSPTVTKEDDEEVMAEYATPMADSEMDTVMDVADTMEGEKGSSSGGVKRKRGRKPKAPVKAPARKIIGEDVCFICFDGGDLVLCDRRGCPKAYHPSCVNRDEAFFRAKGRWNCGWHICSNCEKNAYYMCYTCTFSLCKGCIKDAVILCVRGSKGFCETCMKTVMLIENNEAQVDFDDRSSWEFLFKDYWIDLKAKIDLSINELEQAKNPWKGTDALANKQELTEEMYDNNDGGSSSDSSENLDITKSKRRKAKKRSKSVPKEVDVPSAAAAIHAEGTSTPGNTEWASKELLEFVMHMRNGDKSVVSQFDVQALLLEYIKRNKLRDPRRKSQIICDSRLENLFGKARVGHFEMLKLLESHFLIKEDSQTDDIQGTVVDTEFNQLEADGNMDAPLKGGKDRRRKIRKRGDDRGPQSNLDDYAAIDIHNINLIYFRRKLMEDLIEDIEKFRDKVVGTFVRIRISGSNQKQDIYRLVQVVGTSKATEPYKIGKRTTDEVLEILNLNKTEVISIDTISNQEFTEWLETEIVRLSHLRDRASEKGRRKELRECVEKLQLLKTPEERRRRLEETPEIHADPNMDPGHESEEDNSEMEDNKRESFMRPRGSGFSRKGREPLSPRSGSFSSKDSWSGTRKNSSQNWELNRTMSNKNYLNKGEETTLAGETPNEKVWNQGRDIDAKQSNNLEKFNSAIDSETVGWNSHSLVKSESFSGVASESSPASLSSGLAENAAKISETDKIWHYQDPSGKVQGPFSMGQLRKWNNTGYFPVDLKIWRSTEKQDDSLLLTDALAGRFQKELPPVNMFTKAENVLSPHLSSTHAGRSHGTSLQKVELSSSTGWATPSVEVTKLSTDQRDSDYGSRTDSSNLPSPTPKQSTPGSTGGQAFENKWSASPFPVHQEGSVLGANLFPGSNGVLQSHDLATPDNGQPTRSSTFSSINQDGSKKHNAVESIGVSAPTSVLNSNLQLTRVSENDSLSSHTGLSLAPNSGQGFPVGPTNALPVSQSTAVAPRATPMSESHSWGSAPTQKLEANSSIPSPVSQMAWGGVPSTVQNSGGNLLNPGFSALPPPDPWRPPIPVNQSNVQPPAQPTMQWGMVVAENNTFAPGPRPENPNAGWGLMPGNPNLGWGGQAPGTNMNWGAIAQGPVPGNPNVGWVMPPVNPGATVQGPVSGNVNMGWVAPTGNSGAIVQGLTPGNANPSWATPMGNPGPTVQGQPPGNVNRGWVTSSGNHGAVQGPPGNANPGWGAPAGNQGTRGGEQRRNGDRFSGQRDSGSQGGDSGYGGGRRWNRDSSFGREQGGFDRLPKGQRLCPYQQHGYCKKGAACDYMHT